MPSIGNQDKINRQLDECATIALRYLRKDQCRRAIDGGAHLGLFAQRLIPHFAHVTAFEPNPMCWPTLSAMNNEHFLFYTHALGDEMASIQLANAEASSRSYYFLKDDTGPGRMIDLDYFGFDDVDFIKLNIEGAELLALQGAVQTIQKTWPVLLVEMKGYGERFGYHTEDMHGFLQELGYTKVDRRKGMMLYVHEKAER